MSPGFSTLIVTSLWALPIIIALILMAVYYRPPDIDEITKADEVASKE